MIVAFDFGRSIAFVKFIGTHAEYDRVDALTVSQTQTPSRRAMLRGFAMGSAASAIAASGIVAVVLRGDDEL